MRRSPGKGEWQEFASSPLGLGTVEILFGGRVWIFVWCWLGGVGDGCGVAWDEFVVVAEEDDSLVTRPIPTKGIPLDDCNASREAIRGTLSRFDAKSCCLAVIVRPDSYGVFKQVRDQAIALKFDYRLLPTEADSPIVTAEASQTAESLGKTGVNDPNRTCGFSDRLRHLPGSGLAADACPRKAGCQQAGHPLEVGYPCRLPKIVKILY